MGGKIRKGSSIITGVVRDEIKERIDLLVRKGMYKSRCQAVGDILTNFFNKNPSNQKTSHFNADKPADKPPFPVIDYSLVDENYLVL